MTGPGDGESLRLTLHHLSHEETRSGASIAETLGISRAAVWKHIEALRELGIEVDAVAGQGYRLREPLELMNSDAILSRLGPASGALLQRLLLLGTVDSTNDRVKALGTDSNHAIAVVAEQQLAGKGRRGRGWVSPFARNIYLSLGWRFERGVADLGCLPLVVALAACEALDACGVSGVRIKWPNDLLLGSAKLGGCLVEVQGDAVGPCLAIVGVGINVRMQAQLAGGIDQPWTDAASVCPDISRNDLAGSLLEALISGIGRYTDQGFAPFHDSWKRRDALCGKTVKVMQPNRTHEGVAIGINEKGNLKLQFASGVAEYGSGEVSIHYKDL